MSDKTFFTPFLLASSLALAACAGPPRLRGAVTPMQGGNHQSSVKAGDRTAALKSFDSDAKQTCGTTGAIAALSKPGKYSIVSQDIVDKAAKDVKSSDNKMVDAGISAGMRHLGLEGKDSVEITTVFKCE